jgi:hypothetical protein
LLLLPNDINGVTAFKGEFIPYNLKDNKDAADPSTYPISWATDIDEVIEQMRGNQEVCFWLFDNVMECIAGSDAWKSNVRSGNKSPAEFTTPSSEALLWILLKNHWTDWERKATMHGRTNDDMGSITSGLTTDSEESLTLFTKQNKGSTKGGWSEEGLNYYNELKEKVEADRNSERGKEFERSFKEKMMERASAAGANKRKRASASRRVEVANDLSNDEQEDDTQRMEPV